MNGYETLLSNLLVVVLDVVVILFVVLYDLMVDCVVEFFKDQVDVEGGILIKKIVLDEWV